MAEQFYTDQAGNQIKFDETMPTAVGSRTRLINCLLDAALLAITATFILFTFFPKAAVSPESVVFVGVLYTLQFTYYFFSEYFFGRTLAKLITRTYVVTEYNEKPALTAILIRTLCRYIPFEYLTFLGSGIGWHDKFSKTYVVRKAGY